ncbi:hypothetical protein [Tenuifilum osseticum]|uniref:hypothetical protein n=1 Tax=Tenuifilum osseticum TaxID=3374723 RepID=UPI0034E591FC
MNTEKKYSELKNYLKRGDAPKLARLTGYSAITIRAMLQGKRTMHPLVEAAIKKLTESRINSMDKEVTQIK